MSEPGEDTCLMCKHPDHAGTSCGALMGIFYGDDGSVEDDRCDCDPCPECWAGHGTHMSWCLTGSQTHAETGDAQVTHAVVSG